MLCLSQQGRRLLPAVARLNSKCMSSRTTSHPDVGRRVEEIDTPALILDMDAFEHNVGIMRAATQRLKVDWRPHIKAHKCPEIAKRLIAGGAVGVTSAKVSEAEAMADGGIKDILIANEIVGETKIRRLASLARRTRLCVAVDDADNIRDIARIAKAEGVTIDVFVDINVNMNRCGVPPEQAPALAETARSLEGKGVHLRGLMGYEGHLQIMAPPDKERETISSQSVLRRAKEAVEKAGIKVEAVSGAGSGNFLYAAKEGVLTEVQAGGGALMDRLYFDKGGLGAEGHKYATFIVTQIVSTPKEGGRAMGDAGFKCTGWHVAGGIPAVYGRDDIECNGLSAEHTKFVLKPGKTVKRGERVMIIPGYNDACGLLHRRWHSVRKGVVQAVWPVTGAGALQ